MAKDSNLVNLAKIMKAIVLYYSHRGTTANYGREIAMYLWSKGLSVGLYPITEFDKTKLQDADFLIIGCWTCGCFVVAQHPHRRWKECAERFSGILPSERIMLFTTYKIATGSMFRKMEKTLRISKKIKAARLKSKTGFLSEADKKCIDAYISINN